MKPTWTLLPDLPDLPVTPRDIVQEQEEAIISRIGLALWGELCQREMEERNEQAEKATVS
jgi:hypothetical protein